MPKVIYLSGFHKGRALRCDHDHSSIRRKILAENNLPMQIMHHTGTQIWDSGLKDRSWEERMMGVLEIFSTCDELHLVHGWQEDYEAVLLRTIAMVTKRVIIYH